MYYKINYDDELAHHGILGQKWGVRRYQNEDGSLTAAGKQRYGSVPEGTSSSPTTKNKTTASADSAQKLKKAAIAVTAATTIAAATVIYAKNKDNIDSFIKNNVTNSNLYMPNRETYRSVVKDNAAREYVKTNKSNILKSAAKLNKYKDYLSDSEVREAKKKLELTRDLHQLQQDNIKRGANYLQSVLTYGTVAVSAYNLTKSSLAKDAKQKHDRRKTSK